jgi:glycosyltransferase involved in cell wall biosynthesis
VEILGVARTEAAADHYKSQNVPVQVLPFGSRLNPRVYGAFNRVIKSFRPDVIHIFENKDVLPVMVAASRRRIPLVFYRCARLTPSRLNPLDQLIYFRKGGVDRFAACSEATAQSLRDAGVPADRVVTLYHGHDPGEFDADPHDLRTELKIAADQFVLGYVANIRPVKGFDILVEAVKLLESSNLQVAVIGTDLEGTAEKLVHEAGLDKRFRFLGPRPRAFRWIRSMDALVIPSRSEGLSRAAIEGMSLNRVVIASRVGGLTEFIDDQVDGFLVPPESPKLLAETIKRVVNDSDLRQRIGARARAKIQSRFSVEAATERAFKLYSELIAQRRRVTSDE